MPTSARKSSIGIGRRGPQKAHIPYRGDNPNVGKKTGVAIQHVERKSDGFEPFEELIGQADGRTPPRYKGKKKSMSVHDDDEDEDDYDSEDEYGEMSMEVDSPLQNHVGDMRAPTTPSNGRRLSRPVARTSTIDYDQIPSPGARKAAQSGRPGPSRLSKSYVSDREPSSEPGERYEEEDSGMQMDDFHHDAPPETEDSPRRTSFTQIDQDDDDDDDDNFPDHYPDPEPEPEPFEEEPPSEETPKPKKDKGKGKSEPLFLAGSDENEDDEVEDEIARGLSDVNQAPPSDEEEEEEVQKPSKRSKVQIKEPPKQIRTKTGSKKENRPVRDGVRRSAREHYKPLEWWRGEKVVYGKPDFQQPVLVPHIREIIRIPKEPPQPLSHKRKRGRSRSRTVQPQPPPPSTVDLNPEEGWDDETVPVAKVLEYRNGEEVKKRIAWTAAMVDPKQVPNGDWAYEKILWDSDFIAAGQLVIPPKCRKPSKATKDNTYIFYVIEGAINLKIHDSTLVLATGGMFMVPRGNTYFIENISQRSAKLFFTQARKAVNDEEERAVVIANNITRQKRKARRSSSAGPITNRGDSSAPAAYNADLTPVAPRGASKRPS